MYLAQCLSGHVNDVPVGSKLETLCKKREAEGKIDAICLSDKECPRCIDESVETMEREARMCSNVGCPMGDDDCKDGCLAIRDISPLIQLQLSNPLLQPANP